jgi:hypothetical protein
MSDPIRLRDESAAARGLLDAARKPKAMPSEVRARSAARIAAMAAAPTIAATTGWKTLTGKTIGIAAFAAIGVGAGLAVWSWSHHGDRVRVEEPTKASSSATPQNTAIPWAPMPSPTSVPVPAPNANATASTTTIATPTPSVAPSTSALSDALAEETKLLDAARAKINGDPTGALAILDEHRAKFPAGKLAAEREYLSVRVLVALGRRDEAKARADAFLKRWPESPLASVVRDLVQ